MEQPEKRRDHENLLQCSSFSSSNLSEIRIAVGGGEPGIGDVEGVSLGVDGLGLGLGGRVRRVEVTHVGPVGNVAIVDNVLKSKLFVLVLSYKA